jgi:GntR family transcriptional repressor for pyruvate dehydrogenase complex
LFTSIQNTKNYEIIIDQIKSAIVDGSIKIGDRLPSEEELTVQFNVSRSSVREALKALEVLGIVESRKGGGSFVVNNISKSASDNLSLYFRLCGGTLSDIISMRLSLELGAVYTIIKDGSGDDIDALGKVLDKYLNAQDSEERQIQDQNFHALLISYANNPLFDFILSSLTSILAMDISYSHKADLDLNDQAVSLELHRQLMKAIRDRDFSTASKALYAHYDFTAESMKCQSEYFNRDFYRKA